jgi:hypothetical protein
MKKQLLTSAPDALHAWQPLPSPGSPLHLILRLRHREHWLSISISRTLGRMMRRTAYRYSNSAPCVACWAFRLRFMDQGAGDWAPAIFGPEILTRLIIVAVWAGAVVVASTGHGALRRCRATVERIKLAASVVRLRHHHAASHQYLRAAYA